MEAMTTSTQEENRIRKNLVGKNLIGWEQTSSGSYTFRSFDPKAGESIGPDFHEASASEVARAAELADVAAAGMSRLSGQQIAEFLIAIREEILAIGDELIDRAAQETALDKDRLKGERDRTVNQIKMFADLVTEGSWVDARIETALPDRKPVPRPDLRRMLRPIGPVAVFGASNFPMAFSVAGGDTISALAAGNPVIVKAHPAHPGTSQLVGDAVVKAAHRKGMPEGTFGMLHGKTPETSIALVTNPKIRAIGFTGSGRVGRALFDAAARRTVPIPVYAEMGSVNPIFILPEVLKSKGQTVAEGLFRSVSMGMGQFCTSPGLVFTISGEGAQGFEEKLVEAFEHSTPGTMLNPAIRNAYTEKLHTAAKAPGVEAHFSAHGPEEKQTEGQPGVLVTWSDAWLRNKELHEEIFGPATILVKCGTQEQLLEAARSLEGSLTATIHGTPEELERNFELVHVLSTKAGRVIFNGFPTGVEVGQAMHHGGPYPATTDEKFTSVGSTAIYRFARPICYQNFPEQLLPSELRNANPGKIWRTINGRFTQEPVE